MIASPESELILTIARAGADGGTWPVMLAAISAHLQADTAELRLSRAGWTITGPTNQPMPEVLAGLRLNRVYTGEELTDRISGPDPLAHSADSRAIGMRLTDGAAWLLLTRRRTLFRAVDSAILAALAPHVAQALALATRINSLQTRAERAEQALRGIGIGTLHWDQHGRPVPMDAIAHAFVQSLPAVTAASLPPAGTIYCKLAPGIEMLVLAEPDGRRIGILRACDRPLPAPGILAQALGIGLAEARLAHALGQGDTLPEAAARLGITLETARFYSKQIYAKTGLRGQPDLMRRIWSSLLTLGCVPTA
jgi:DNA-binding CsgD family transcriptional regulator